MDKAKDTTNGHCFILIRPIYICRNLLCHGDEPSMGAMVCKDGRILLFSENEIEKNWKAALREDSDIWNSSRTRFGGGKQLGVK